MGVAPLSLQLPHQLIGGGGRCLLVDLALRGQPEIFAGLRSGLFPGQIHFPEARKVPSTPMLRLLGSVWWSSVLHGDGLPCTDYQ